MSERKEARQAESLQITGERWQGANDQRAKADAANAGPVAGPRGAASSSPINRHVDTEAEELRRAVAKFRYEAWKQGDGDG